MCQDGKSIVSAEAVMNALRINVATAQFHGIDIEIIDAWQAEGSIFIKEQPPAESVSIRENSAC